ncbi:hypothetical protein E1B28_000584 [Marasmius oreades]|uniref:Selenoprotein O n=1 Tax=Marasmius oreades TaxID=181124 RepID=A0A9P8AER8_9AGAR|nr:uncharacterized protein E1B28_000584 [Marasmius oreades]KAG7098670.1 hypothetical protein E1B28_000584 [Marasmius oreades]
MLHRLATMSVPKTRISTLPLPPSTHLITHNLTPDPHTPSPKAFINHVIPNNPSIQRRARLISPEAHFSYVTPFPLPFPYHVEPPKDVNEEDLDKSKVIEQWLSDREAKHPRDDDGIENKLRLHYPKNRDQPGILIGLSETGLRDCVPHLDVGDAFAQLGTPSLVTEPVSVNGKIENPISSSEDAVAVRQELIDVLSGHAVLMSSDYPAAEGEEGEQKRGFVPWSLRYSGHQFGSWAGQLGDGRATSVMVTPHPNHPEETYELQLKGAGRTPYSRSADGLAVVRSSIREFLCSEAMHALQIPTTRSLSLISLPSLPVARERMETACIMTRVAPSFIRIGNFEALNGPMRMMFFGGGQQESNLEALRTLGEWVAKRVLGLTVALQGGAWAKPLLMEVARRNAVMVAGWQVYGFMHGVINTDNVSIMGLTIDYGPYAFMDVFDSMHICNHSDDGGRYTYRNQPSMIIFALRALLNALSPLIGAELSNKGKPIPTDFFKDASEEQIDEWKAAAMKECKDELERMTQEEMSIEYGRLMRKRLGLRRQDETDESQLSRPLLNILENQKLDFHRTFRVLSSFRPSMEGEELDKYIQSLLSNISEPLMVDEMDAKREWREWLGKYKDRILSEQELWTGEEWEKLRVEEAKRANPRFVLRQWVLEEVIRKVEADAESGKRVLGKVLQMACNPFDSWGAEGDARAEESLTAEEKEERRLCGVGEASMLGFQCSCSS